MDHCWLRWACYHSRQPYHVCVSFAIAKKLSCNRSARSSDDYMAFNIRLSSVPIWAEQVLPAGHCRRLDGTEDELKLGLRRLAEQAPCGWNL